MKRDWIAQRNVNNNVPLCFSATYNRRNIDVKFDNQTVSGKTTDKTKEFNYM